MIQSIDSKIDHLIQEVKNVNRRLDSISKKQDTLQISVNILDKDRELMESIHVIQGELKDLLNFSRTHQTDVHRELKAEIAEVKDSLEDLPKETENAITDGFKDVVESVKRSRTVQVKPSLWERFLRL